jgi:hypothetical protein
MRKVVFRAYGHENIIGEHRTTIELTSENWVTKRGTCIIGVKSERTLYSLDDDIRNLAKLPETRILLRLTVGGICQEIEGRGSPGLTYSDMTSMVARTSDYECGRTVMVRANKAASNLDRDFIAHLKHSDCVIKCELVYITQE